MRDLLGLLFFGLFIIVVIALIWYYCTPRRAPGELSADYQPPKPKD